MYYNRDEFMLLSRRGSVPPATRHGPPGRHPGQGDLPAGEPWLLQLLGGAIRSMARHRSAVGYADRESYREMEFAVGFGAEDEPWL